MAFFNAGNSSGHRKHQKNVSRKDWVGKSCYSEGKQNIQVCSLIGLLILLLVCPLVTFGYFDIAAAAIVPGWSSTLLPLPILTQLGLSSIPTCFKMGRNALKHHAWLERCLWRDLLQVAAYFTSQKKCSEDAALWAGCCNGWSLKR